MVAEPWLIRIGSHVTSNLKHALLSDSSSSKKSTPNQSPETIGILSFEVANLISKTVRLHKSLTNSEISNLKSEILTSHGVRTLVSSDDTQLLDLALSEKLEELTFIAGDVSRLGKKSTVPQLQGFQHVFNDIITGAIDVRELGFLVKDMDAMVRKLERFVSSTATLYGEMAVLNELEIATKKFQQNQHEESRKVFEQKLIWQIQDVRHLKDVSLWNQTYDKIMEMLARTVCTLYARICSVFVDSISKRHMFSNGSISSSTVSVSVPGSRLSSCKSVAQKSDQIDVCSSVKSCGASSNNLSSVDKKMVNNGRPQMKGQDLKTACGYGPGRLLMDCLSINTSKLDDFDDGSCSNER
ncbi:hypothetical protein OSB04_029613 [Centaurea solstitialis]|uniref:DUF3475 domain-containing protein n=1 Tax=Centaurea solstitialis TaxID=347529 RepID=A0AA38S613_9ASTR|nr:hypothetical protein OSB04_029613 [Centaurea solstitialis]